MTIPQVYGTYVGLIHLNCKTRYIHFTISIINLTLVWHILFNFPGRFLTPIHESPAHEKQESGTQEANVVFYSDTSHPVNDSSRAQLLSKNSSVVLTEDSSDSGVAQDSDTPLNNSPSNNNTPNDQPIVFNVTFFPDTESTEC